MAEPYAEDAPRTYTVGAIEVIDPWARSAIGEAHNAQVFFEFRNRGAVADRLVGAGTVLAQGPAILRLAPGTVVSQIEIPAGGEAFELSNSGYFIELTGLSVPLTMGKEFPLILRFAQAGTVEVTVTSRFHSPQLARRIRAAAQRGDLEGLRKLKQ